MRGSRAFSLIEVLSALALLVLLSGSVMSFFFGLVGRHDRLVALSAQQRDVSLLFGQLEAALFCAVAVGPDGARGVSGTRDGLAVVTRSVGPSIEGDGALSDAMQVSFSFVEPESAITMDMKPLGAESARQSATMLEGVERLRFRFSDGRSWSPDFDSFSAGTIPVAVEVSVWLGGVPEDAQAETADDLPPLDDMEPWTPLAEDTPPAEPFDDELENLWVPREPDFMRVIVIPDAPVSGWKAGSS